MRLLRATATMMERSMIMGTTRSMSTSDSKGLEDRDEDGKSIKEEGKS